MKMKPYACGQCGYLALEISDLHNHLLDHSDVVGYFFDINYRTAYPKHQYSDSQTQTEEEVIKDTVLDDDLSELSSEVSTSENSEWQAICTDIDHLIKESEISSKQELADAGLEFYKDTFEGIDSSASSSDSEQSMQNTYLVPMGESDQYTGLTANTNHSPVNKFYMLRSNSRRLVENEHSSQNSSQFKQAKYMRKQKQRKQTDETSSSDSYEDSGVETASDVTVDSTDTNSVNDNLTGIPETVNDVVPQIIQTKKKVYVLKRYRQYMYFYNTCVGRNNSSVFNCTICSFSCKKINQMRAHISTHNCEFVICDICGKSLPDEEILSKHRMYCIRKFKCRICEASFARTTERIEHERSHNGVLPFVCDHCGKGFRVPSYLNSHLLCVHSEVRKHKCRKCKKSFKFASGLSRHERIHNKVLAHSCQFCEKKFTTRWNMKSHMRKHTGDKPYSCEKCGDSFTHNVVRKTHQAKCQAVPG